MNCRLVVCDLDGTLISVSSEFVFVKGLVRRGVLSWRVSFQLFASLPPASRENLYRGQRLEQRLFQGASFSVMMEEVHQDVPFLLKNIRPSVLEYMHHRKEQGAKLCLLSASISPLVQAVAGELDIHCYRGSIPAVKDGRCTGNLVGQRPWGRAKVAPALALMDQFKISPEETVALGDSWSDRFVMDVCGGAVAVDPGKRLAKLAGEKGWEILAGKKQNS